MREPCRGVSLGVQMIGDIGPEHYPHILKINSEFVHWLSPLNEARLKWILERATYARQIKEAQAILIGYGHDVDYPNHKNIAWLSNHVENFFYIERIIIDIASQGRGFGRRLYEDVEAFAAARGYTNLACEVNTVPNNPGSHKFHQALGYITLGDVDYPAHGAALRYYAKQI